MQSPLDGEMKGVIAVFNAMKAVELKLKSELREDGPILGMEFDRLPAGAFSAKMKTSSRKRAWSYIDRMGLSQSSVQGSQRHGVPNEEEAPRLQMKRKTSSGDGAWSYSGYAGTRNAHMGLSQSSEQGSQHHVVPNEEEAPHLRMKRTEEDQIQRKMEKHDRERRKEEDRTKLRAEERRQQEQKRELEKREKLLQKQNLRDEKMRQKEANCSEKEAARQKAAYERENARRIAKESMELIEDELLELMELAASSKDMLVTFPPKSVQLSMPFTIQPWKDSEENVGNLLMVWSFLISFADVLELWPFTLDEFVQAFHDYDPRLFGEIHVALLRSIVKDIEDAARTPSMGLGANQNNSANLGGGHPHIVDGAYAWGFDIRSWQQHLNPLTWPEVLRQFAFSAGFGPQLSPNSSGASTNDLEDAENGETNTGEPWVQGLMEGEYADLTVEERLNALVALIGVASEGNSLRVILEERLEAANTLYKQLWAEGQLDKRWMKEEPISYPSNAPKNYQKQHAQALSLKLRSEFKSFIGRIAEDTYVYRSLPLGQDRKRNRYWQFVTSSKNDPGAGRIFFESQGCCWRLIDTEEAFDTLLSSLDIRGIRESHLHSMLRKVEVSFKDVVRRNSNCKNHGSPSEERVRTEVSEMVSSPDRSVRIENPTSTVCALGSDTALQSSSSKIDLGRNGTEKTAALERYQDLQRWMWKECFDPSTMCAIKYGKKRCEELLSTCDLCLDLYLTEDNIHCLETSLPPRIRLLKALLAITEASVPPEAIQPLWTEDSRNSWVLKLKSSSSAEDLLQCHVPTRALTTGGVALRLLELDASITENAKKSTGFFTPKNVVL